jgi:serine phosphatase RsbU (regulator of sigma subunit)/anti-sigma regulatory factor (Ser/Thr protein kinase)
VEPALSRLDAVVTGDPAQRKRASSIRSATEAGVQILKSYVAFYERGQKANARALVASNRTKRVSTQLQTVFNDFEDAQRSVTIARFNEVRPQVQRFVMALVLVSIAGIIIALFVSARFGLNIARRLRQLAENARLLAAGEPSQPITGGDEIAALDRVYHDMTLRIQREHRVASALQRVLLPQELPEIPGLRIDTAYVPAAKGAEVGGDWYDVFALSGRRVCISVGDVAGHGLRAASIMGTARLAIRTAARIEAEPAAILQHTNRVLCADEPNVVVTAFVGILDLSDGTLSYAIAGHPAPIHVRPGGPLEFLHGEGLVLGIDARTRFEQHLYRVHEGSGLVFYTDGIVEVQRDYLKGLEEFTDAVRAESRGTSENIAEAIQRRVLARRQPRDDCALMFLGVTALGPAPAERRRRTWTIDAREESAARRLKRALLWQLGEVASNESDLSAVELIVSELVGNVARHAPGHAEVTLVYNDGTAVLHVSDTGAPFQPRNGAPEVYAEGGRGLFLVRSFSRDMKVERIENGNRVSVVLPVSLD